MTYNQEETNKRILINMAINHVMEKIKASSVTSIIRNEEIHISEIKSLYLLYRKIHQGIDNNDNRKDN